jgi:hypothetical protein
MINDSSIFFSYSWQSWYAMGSIIAVCALYISICTPPEKAFLLYAAGTLQVPFVNKITPVEEWPRMSPISMRVSSVNAIDLNRAAPRRFKQMRVDVAQHCSKLQDTRFLPVILFLLHQKVRYSVMVMERWNSSSDRWRFYDPPRDGTLKPYLYNTTTRFPASICFLKRPSRQPDDKCSRS